MDTSNKAFSSFKVKFVSRLFPEPNKLLSLSDTVIPAPASPEKVPPAKN